MKVSYEGVAEQVATFQVDGASNPAVQSGDRGGTLRQRHGEGLPGQHGPCRAWCWRVKDGLAAVQVAGYMRLPCAAALTVGYAQLALDSLQQAGGGHRPGRPGGRGRHGRRHVRRDFLLREKGGALYGTF